MNIIENADYIKYDEETEVFLDDISTNILKENIVMQFEDPLEYHSKDYLETFINSYWYTKDNLNAYEEEDKADLVEIRETFYAFMIHVFYNYLGVSIMNIEDKSEEEQDSLIHYTYKFFINNIKKNFITLVCNYIDREEYSIEDNQDSVTSIAFRNKLSIEDAYILSNLYDIIKSILTEINEYDDVDRFFEECDDDSTVETEFVKAKYAEFVLTGNFIPKYIDMLDSDFISNIETKVRNMILTKYFDPEYQLNESVKEEENVNE